MKNPFFITLWILITRFLAPFLWVYLIVRAYKGKEINSRLKERLGFASLARPAGHLIHFHAASVGEVNSIFPLLITMSKQDSKIVFLITTGTVNSFSVLQQFLAFHKELSSRIVHQFIPLDVPNWTHRFVKNWHPELSILVESELWPNLVKQLHRAKVPLALVNARLSDHSFSRWQHIPKTAKSLLDCFNWIAARSDHDKNNLKKLGVTSHYWGDLKEIAPELPYCEDELNRIKEKLTNKPIWLAASTHPGEENFITQTHKELRKTWPNLVTLIVPRHPERRHEIIEKCGPMALRSLQQYPNKNGLWLVDTLGELGLFYRLCPIVWLGNSLDGLPKGGGHNPFEPAKLHCAIATGSKIDNFKQAYFQLGKAVSIINDCSALTLWVNDMLSNPQKRENQARLAFEIVSTQNQFLEKISRTLLTIRAKPS
ncbi:3-deoxy-D-manno-octulosonic acid transferase [Commensalibacter sp. Nvir]|uniref:3-deoxy-D-manno-octulosonic acid transferase n=1 Tax=Commensalibacter sp. Nvir TaxID=3069817 RepID=UPI002D7090B4|nr:3-deoxy-D-manno-octulosonic acid transferase [Commensalibacter sp. Nvir]